MDANQFQKSIGIRVKDYHKLVTEGKMEVTELVLGEMEALAGSALNRFVYLWKGWGEGDNIQVTEDICMLLSCIAEYASIKGYNLSEMMNKAIHLRNRTKNDREGVN